MSANSPDEVERLLLREIAQHNSTEETRRLLDCDAASRVRGTESLLLNILDRIADHDYSRGDGAFLRDCHATTTRLREHTDGVDPAWTGLLGLICLNVKLLQRRFETPSRSNRERADEYCRRLFAETPIRRAVYAVYRPVERPDSGGSRTEASAFERRSWENVDFDSVEYHRAGTTSFILSGHTRESIDESGAYRALAVKCVLFPWHKLASIAQATDDYAAVYGAAQTSPVVVHPIASTDRWIVMPFQNGQTLSEHLAEFERANPSVGERIGKAEEVGRLLIHALHRLAGMRPVATNRPENQHLDLSPNNIILVPDSPEVRFIDLGRNHLYSRQVGIVEHDDSVYVAPEVKNRANSATADVYSLGIILTQILTGHPPREGRAPDEIWEISPALGRALEDFIEEDPHRRLLLPLPAADQPFSFADLGRYFELICNVSASEPEASSKGQRRWLARLLPTSREVRTQWDQWRVARRSSFENDNSSYLLFFSLVATACWWFIAARTALIKLDDIIAFNLRDLPDGTVLAASVIAFTQGLLGAKFYQTVFARLTVRKIPGALARTTEISLRFMAVVAMPATIIAVIWKPSLWAWCSAVIGLIVALTEWLTLILATRITRAGVESKFSTIPPAGQIFLRGYEQWWWTMLLYAFLIGFIALGLQLGWLHDLWPIVFGITVVSVGIHYLSKFVGAGHAVRGGLARAFSTGERIAILHARGDVDHEHWPPRLRGPRTVS